MRLVYTTADRRSTLEHCPVQKQNAIQSPKKSTLRMIKVELDAHTHLLLKFPRPLRSIVTVARMCANSVRLRTACARPHLKPGCNFRYRWVGLFCATQLLVGTFRTQTEGPTLYRVPSATQTIPALFLWIQFSLNTQYYTCQHPFCIRSRCPYRSPLPHRRTRRGCVPLFFVRPLFLTRCINAPLLLHVIGGWLCHHDGHGDTLVQFRVLGKSECIDAGAAAIWPHNNFRRSE